MASENSETATRVSNWTLATGTKAGHRNVANAGVLPPVKRALQNVVVVARHPFPQSIDFPLNINDDAVLSLESTGRAYSHVKRMQPGRVIVYLEMDDAASFLLLSMLRLDPDTSHIPIAICTTAREAEGLTAMNTWPNAKGESMLGNLAAFPRRRAQCLSSAALAVCHAAVLSSGVLQARPGRGDDRHDDQPLPHSRKARGGRHGRRLPR